jgi:hypothetical protein
MPDPIKSDSTQTIKVNIPSDSGGEMRDGVKYVSHDVWFNAPKVIHNVAKETAQNITKSDPNALVTVKTIGGKYQITVKSAGTSDKDAEGVLAVLKKNNIEAKFIQIGKLMVFNTDLAVKI